LDPLEFVGAVGARDARVADAQRGFLVGVVDEV
jgi:hypothetical protein